MHNGKLLPALPAELAIDGQEADETSSSTCRLPPPLSSQTTEPCLFLLAHVRMDRQKRKARTDLRSTTCDLLQLRRSPVACTFIRHLDMGRTAEGNAPLPMRQNKAEHSRAKQRQGTTAKTQGESRKHHNTSYRSHLTSFSIVNSRRDLLSVC